ncbi:Na+/H+ antiporter subunit D [Cerasicoccus fimbriatus]|uniref:Na+/H+ antiporter subunit D n=1 Tax=Cerasicoccus fimbriatus TaxID=3014554 RepID=UPI0022B34EBF|nr:Na+/H+ antiporter subunit D [Cerasicoccus sp. TK19100]
MIWLLACIIIPALSALLCLLTSQRTVWNRGIAVVGAGALLAASTKLFTEVWDNGFVTFQSGGWPSPFGITLIADLFSASMVLITGIVALAVVIYSLRDIEERLIHSHYYALFHLLITGVNGAFITGDLFNLYVWFEVMLLASFVLITLGGSRAELEGGVKYLIINLVSSILFLCGVGLLYGKLGTLNMADIAARLAGSNDAFLINSSAMFLLAAFGVKAALFPFFFWLPASYHTPRVAISALFAGLLTKVGVYALIRSYTLLFHSQFEVVQGMLIFLAGATMVTGVLGAAAQYEIRKILSFHIISQIGYMVMGLAIGSALALTGAIFYTLHHIIVKTNLFLLGGVIIRRCGTANLKEIGGLYRWAPGLSLLFFIPAFSLGGIPPLSGFWAKFSVIKAGLDAELYVLVTVALLVGVLTLYSMTKIWAEAFWKDAPQGNKPENLGQAGWSLVTPCVALAVMTVIIGLWSQPLFALAESASAQLLDPQAYIDEVLKPQTTTHYGPN